MKKLGIIKKKRKWIIIVGILVLLVIIAGFFLSRKAKMNKMSAISVSEAEASLGTVASTITGSGNISMSETVGVSVPTGILVEEVCVEAGDTVKKGTVLARLDTTSIAAQLVEANDALDDVNDKLDDDDLSDYEEEQLEGEKKEIKEWIADLEELHDSPQIVASKAGIIASISLVEGQETSKSSSTNTTGSSYSSTTSLSASYTSTISHTSGSSTSIAHVDSALSTGTSSAAAAGKYNITASYASVQTNQNTVTASRLSTSSEEGEETEVITDFSDLNISQPETGASPQSDIDSTSYYSGSISWNCDDSTFQAGTSYTAVITLTAKDGYTFSAKSVPSISGASGSVVVSDDGSEMVIKATYASTEAEESTEESSDSTTEAQSTTSASQSTGASSSGSSSGQSSTSQSAQGLTGNSATSGSTSLGGSASFGGSSSMSGSSSLASGSASASSASSSSSYEYGTYECEACTIQLQDEATVVINVDELDILSIEEGQEATITLDALEDVELEGKITKISNTANTNSNSVTYPVTITLPKQDNLMDGMSATAVITIDKSENVVTIPVLALQEKGDQVYVYTEKSEDGSLSGEVTVETGLSDGTTVEIKSGLEEGSTVYYVRTGSDDSDWSSIMGGGNGGGHGDFQGGERPSGGDMPSGGMPSGNGGGPQ